MICVDLRGSSTIIVGSILWIMLLNSGRLMSKWEPAATSQRSRLGSRHSLPLPLVQLVSDDDEYLGVYLGRKHEATTFGNLSFVACLHIPLPWCCPSGRVSHDEVYLDSEED